MAYNTELEQMIEKIHADRNGLEMKKMFGGIGYLLHGNICFGIYKDYLVLRTTPEKAAKHLEKEGFLPFDITGTAMKGWVMIEPIIYRKPETLRKLLDEGIRFASTLPKK